MTTKSVLRIPREDGELIISKVEGGARKFVEFRRSRQGRDDVVLVPSCELGSVIDVLKAARAEFLGLPRNK